MTQLHQIPFHSQIWNLEKWQEFGFKNKEEARYWQGSSCGILCLKMSIEGVLNKKTDSISALISKGNLLGAYSHDIGWSHKGLAKLAQQYEVDARIRENITVKDLIRLIDDRFIPIISIRWAFEGNKTLKEKLSFWKKKGGHLALVIGYNDKGFYINHTSTTKGYNWESKLILFDKFKKGFTGRGIVIGARGTFDLYSKK